ncbi:MAG: hypothetical protein Q3966_09145 [Neisseria sp.]|nr:hypothetical protein [Neisseria sp.]
MFWEILRQLFAGLICLYLAVYQAANLFKGIRNGKIAYNGRNGTQWCDRKKQPLHFWLLFALFSILFVLPLLVWWKISDSKWF